MFFGNSRPRRLPGLSGRQEPPEADDSPQALAKKLPDHHRIDGRVARFGPTTPKRAAEREIIPAAAACETLKPDKQNGRRGQVQRLVKRPRQTSWGRATPSRPTS